MPYDQHVDFQTRAFKLVGLGDFKSQWPTQERVILIRAASHVGQFPPYALRLVKHALRVCEGIERRLGKQADAGEQARTRKGMDRTVLR